MLIGILYLLFRKIVLQVRWVLRRTQTDGLLQSCALTTLPFLSYIASHLLLRAMVLRTDYRIVTAIQNALSSSFYLQESLYFPSVLSLRLLKKYVWLFFTIICRLNDNLARNRSPPTFASVEQLIYLMVVDFVLLDLLYLVSCIDDFIF